jgi:SagB-type dehydrogenase family enzyme
MTQQAIPTIAFNHPQRLADRLAIDSMVAPDVLREVEKFHRQSSLLRRSRFGLDMTVFHDKGLLKRLNRRTLRVSDVRVESVADSRKLGVHGLQRDRSQRSFAPTESLALDTLKQLLFHSFSTGASHSGGSAPPCASAGGVYAVNVFVAPLVPVVGAGFKPDSLMHFDRRECVLFRMSSCSAHAAVNVCLDGEPGSAPDSFSGAALMLTYVIDLELSTLRYAERGYRFSLIESGLMAQQATLVGQVLGLSSCMFGGFPDAELASALGLNARKMLPCLVQFFGVPLRAVKL